MIKSLELKYTDLMFDFHTLPDFKTTEEVVPFKSIIGQKRAEASIDLGLNMDKKEYNIFISGHSGTGKTGYIVKKIEDFAKNLPASEDWCYVFNFEDQNTPMAINLETGTALKFKEDIANIIKYLFKEVPVFFNSQSYEREKSLITDKYEDETLKLSNELSKKAKDKNFNLSEASTGEFVFIPLLNEKEMSTKDYSMLKPEEKEAINKNVSELRLLSAEILKKTKQLSKRLEEELKALDDSIAETIVAGKINYLLSTYGKNEKLISYIGLLKKDIVENISSFLEKESEDKNLKEKDKLFFRRYDVNVLVCNSKEKGAPVIFADSADYGSLFGKIEYENKQGNLVTDFTLIRAGSLHQSNGGYLLIKAHQILRNIRVWDELKRCLNLETISISNTKSEFEVLPIITLSPQNIPLKTKVILLGSNILYSLLLKNDLEFEKLFKIKAEFDNEIENDEENTREIVGFLSNYINQNNLLHITRKGVLEILRYSSRLAQNRNYYSASTSRLLQIVDIASYYAEKENSKVIDENHIKSALNENSQMHSLIKKKVLDMYREKKYIVELDGLKIGQINGLSVMDYGDSVIGKQHRITVTTFAGRQGVINIEREAEMSGSIHNKGIMILSGYLGELIGQEASISFNASIVFEQLYSGIEGDSASAAELIALLSSLSDVSLKQSLAITGSVNQKGELQPIGGVNEKIEGYFDICTIFGLNGSHGVIIPKTNVDELLLKDNVIEAVRKGLFHIFAAGNIEECFEILCEDNFKISAKGPLIDEVKNKILLKLKKYNDILKEK